MQGSPALQEAESPASSAILVPLSMTQDFQEHTVPRQSLSDLRINQQAFVVAFSSALQVVFCVNPLLKFEV